MDTRQRSWVKSIVWRLIGILLLAVIAYLITGDWKEMSVITVLFHGIRVLLYYVHERVWERIEWGRVRHPLAVISVTEPLSPEDQKVIEEHLHQMGYLD